MFKQMRWKWQVVRIDDNRIPKELSVGELKTGKYLQYKPSFKDNLNDDLSALRMWHLEENIVNRTE